MTELARKVETLRSHLQTVKALPESGEGWLAISELAEELGERKLAITAASEAKRILANAPRAWLRYGNALSHADRDEEAAEAFRRALALDADFVPALVNLCVACKNLGRYAEAENAIRHALAVSGQTVATDEKAEKDYGVLQWHLALLELVQDDYVSGFAHFRARFHGGTNWKRTVGRAPGWRGEDLSGKTILVAAEQGHGDTLMMARYLPLLKARGARVIFQPHPALTRYFDGWSGADEIAPFGLNIHSPYDYHAPVFDLPYRFGTTIETVPANVPYLPVPAATPHVGKKKIGLVWAGQPDNPRDRTRSLPLAAFTELLALRDYEFHSLTRDLKTGDAEFLAQSNITDHQPELSDFSDAAKLIASMDLVITCDTAAAHMAGGLGKPVWTLLPFAPDWRWGLARETCPWYPSMRLFRQRVRGDWAGVMARVKAALETGL